MTASMRSLQISEQDGPTLEDLGVTETAIPDAGPADVLVEVEATSVGLTVYRRIERFLDGDGSLPRIPGHEIVGTVRETGNCVTHLEPGDRVAAYYYLSCDRCDACRSGREPLCEDPRGQVGVDIDGGFAEYASLPENTAIEIPDGLDPVQATVVPDAVGTPYHVASRRANVEPGDRVMVLGAGGGVGIHLVQMVQYFGGDVTAVDLDDDKLDRCRDLGAERTINTAADSFTGTFTVGGRPYDAVVDFTGATDLIEGAVDVLADGGRLVNMTGFEGATIEIPTRALVRGEREVAGSRYCSKGEFRAAAELVADGTIEPVISEVVELDELTDLLGRIAAAEHLGRGAVTP